MKKYIKIILFFFLSFIPLLTSSSYAATSLDLNNINLNSIDEKKQEQLQKVIENINVNELESAASVNTTDLNSITSGNINANSVNVNEILEIYQELSTVISNDEIADLLNDNANILKEAGVSSSVISTSETLLRTFDSDAVSDIIQNDLDIDKIISLYENGASLDEILSYVMSSTSTSDKIGIVAKLLFSNKYFKVGFVIFIFVALYSILITGLIFSKAGKHSFATIIPLYRDIVHLKICNLSPWLLLLLFIPIIGWLILVAIAIVGRFELARNFEHGFLFGLGLLFFPIIFRSIIAFSDNEYIGNLEE